MPSRFTQLVLATTLFFFATGHGGGCCSSSDEVLGPPTEATCSQGSPLTYDSFGRQFMESYCTRCHASTLTGAARMGATAFHDFDSLAGVRAVANHIDETAGSGPGATNEAMPPNGNKPSLAERQMLAEWIACGAP